MDESLWSEKTCSSLISDLPLWIIEYAWSNRMEDVLEVLGPPLWLEGDWGHLSLEFPCSIRVVAAESWMVVRARDIKHFERVLEFLDVIHTLLPHLVTSIKHMKIIFGLKTLVIMWMLWDDQSIDSITDKIARFFPDHLPQYRRSSHRHIELMQRTQQDFRSFAQSLARNLDMRKIYIRDLMEEQYGERYALKLEERLSQYLKELDKALPQPTHIDQVLKHPLPLEERGEILQQLLTCNITSQPTALKRLLRCALATHYGRKDTKQEKEAEANRPFLGHFCIALRPSQARAEEEGLLQACSQGSWLNRDKRPLLLQKGSEKIYLDRQMMMLKHKSVLVPEKSQADIDSCMDPQHPERAEPRQATEHKEVEEVTTEPMCSRHGKKMKSILLECSEEFKVQERDVIAAHSECTPPSPNAPLLQSTPQRLTLSSASVLQDSSSTNISLSSHADSTNPSGSEIQPVSSSQTSSLLVPPVQQNTSRTSSVQKMNVSELSPSPSHFKQITLSPRPVQSPFSQLSPPSPIASSSVFSLLPPLSQILSSAPSPLILPMTQITVESTHEISPSPTASSSARKESSSPLFSLQSPSPQISSSDSPSAFPVNQTTLGKEHDISPSPTASSSIQQEFSSPVFTTSSPASLGHQPYSFSNPLSSVTPTPSCDCTQVDPTTRQVLDVLSLSTSVPEGKLKLSLETQGFLLLSRWLQPQVLLCRLSKQDCSVTTLPQAATSQSSDEEVDEDGEENELFDVNLLYSDSESDAQDSDDPDYVPSKRLKF
ncbi:hypothetical protein AOLI_G00095830 [Acnodon oligacanthus]